MIKKLTLGTLMVLVLFAMMYISLWFTIGLAGTLLGIVAFGTMLFIGYVLFTLLSVLFN